METNRNSRQLRHLWICGSGGALHPPPPARPPGQDAPGDSSSHQSRKTSSTGPFNLPPAGRHGASCCQSAPLPGVVHHFLMSLDLVGTSGLRDTGLGSRWAREQFILMPLGWGLTVGRYTGLT